jgi:large subunit ribosomal protein L2
LPNYITFYFYMSRSLFYYRPSTGGRNNTGRITVRHRGGAVARRLFAPFSGYAPPRSFARFRLYPFISGKTIAVCAKASDQLYSFSFLPDRFSDGAFPGYANFGIYSTGFSLAKLYTIPFGSFISHVQLSHKGGPKIGRSPGSSVQLLKRRGSFVTLKLPSGEIRRVPAKYFAVSSTLSARNFTRKVFSKAGELRQLGLRPSVRGCAMNPVDHPHGGRTGESRPSVSPWAVLTKGFRTRSKSVNKRLILRSVQQLKNKK